MFFLMCLLRFSIEGSRRGGEGEGEEREGGEEEAGEKRKTGNADKKQKQHKNPKKQ